jgi:N-acetylglucosaminyl-diphospho-decaprenol L-rhamnosyltransferase
MREEVDIIVVNWNSGDLTLKAVQPYLNYNSLEIKCNVMVVDNASSDNSKNLFEGAIEHVIYNNENEGFGKACNQAFHSGWCNGQYILLLNPDTISDPSVLEHLVGFLNNNPDYAVAGPKQVDKNGNVLLNCGRFPTFFTAVAEVCGLSKIFPKIFVPAPIMTDWDHSYSRDVDHIMGSYMLIRKSIIEKIGFMDESYFTYYEDLDLSKRIAEEGSKSFYDHDHFIYHEGGSSGDKVSSRRLFYSLSSRRNYWKKYFGKTKTFFLPFIRIADCFRKEKELQLKKIRGAYYLYIKSIINKKE